MDNVLVDIRKYDLADRLGVDMISVDELLNKLEETLDKIENLNEKIQELTTTYEEDEDLYRTNDR